MTLGKLSDLAALLLVWLLMEGFIACGGGCIERTGGQGGCPGGVDRWRPMQRLVQNLGCGAQVWLELSASSGQRLGLGRCDLGPWGQQPGGHVGDVGSVPTGRALSRMGDGFCLFHFNFAFCGIHALFEIDHPLIS